MQDFPRSVEYPCITNNTHKTMKRIHIVLGIIVLLIAGVVLWNMKTPSPTHTSTKIKIGILTMTTGNVAFLGENVIKSAQLAAEKLGRADDIEFVIGDVGNLEGQGQSAISAAEKLINVDKVSFIIDGMLSNGTLAAAPVINASKVVAVTPLTGGQNIDDSGEYIFRNGPSDILGGTIPAEQFTQKFGYKNVALLTDNAEYTLDIVKHFRDTFTGKIVSDQTIKPDSTDYRTELIKAKAANPDALFINTATGVSARYVIKQARELGITVPIFTNFLAYGPDLISLAGKSAEGVYVYDPEYDQASANELLSAYKAKFGTDSPIAFHTTGTYDALKMGLEAIDKVGQDGSKIHDYLLKNIQNWKGFNGTVSFDAKGNSGTGFTLKQIQDGKLINVK